LRFALNNSAQAPWAAGEIADAPYHLALLDPSLSGATRDVPITILGSQPSRSSSPTDREIAPFGVGARCYHRLGGSRYTRPRCRPHACPSPWAATRDTTPVATSAAVNSAPRSGAYGAADRAGALKKKKKKKKATTSGHDSSRTRTGSVDWNFNISDHDLRLPAEGQTFRLPVNYNVKVRRRLAQWCEPDVFGRHHRG